jgi:HSP20 family protein
MALPARRREQTTSRPPAFEHRVVLPGQPDPDAVEAAVDDGVLTVRVPGPEPARPRRVEVQPANTT